MRESKCKCQRVRKEALLRILVFIEEEVEVLHGFKQERGMIRIASGCKECK